MKTSNRRGDRAAVVICLLTLSVIGWGSCNRESSDTLPQYFGLYYQSSKGLKEIPLSGEPAYVAATKNVKAAMASRNMENLKAAMNDLYTSCQQASTKPSFIVYHNELQPQMIHLAGIHPPAKGLAAVDLGIAPVANQQSMYRLGPKHPLPRGLYLLSASNGMPSELGGNPQLDCFLVDTTPSEMLKASQ